MQARGDAGLLLTLGFASAMAEAVLIREAMAALGGSELAWGAVLSVWLAALALGAGLGSRRAGGDGARWAPLASVLLALAGAVLLRAAPRLVGVDSGETISLWAAAWLWLAAVAPSAAVAGWAFPALVGDRPGAPGRAYALEGGGALIGGVLFTFALAGSGSAATLVIALGLSAAAALLVGGRRLASVLAVVAALGGAWPAERALARAAWRWAERPGELNHAIDTPEQRLELADGRPAHLFADGRLVATVPDPYRAAPRVHLAMLLHASPARVLAIGALADGSVRHLRLHRPQSLVIVEEDRSGTEALVGWVPGLAEDLDQEGVELRTGDPLRALAAPNRWDMILLLDPDPTSLRRARTRSVEFFRACAERLGEEGVLVVRVGAGDTYLGGPGGRLLALIAASLRQAFPMVTAVPGDEVLLVGSHRPVTLDGALLVGRFRDRGVVDAAVPPELIPQLADPERAAALARFLAFAPTPPSTAAHPRAVLAAAALEEGRRGRPNARLSLALEQAEGRWISVAVIVAAALLPFAAIRPAAAGSAVGAVVGFVSLGWSLLLLACWQASVGAVYSEIGALTAAFMAGLMFGAAAGRRAGGRALLAVLIGGVGLSLAIAAGLPLVWPRSTVVPLLVIGGLLTGAAFPPLAALLGRGARGAGRAFAADEAGAAGGALVVGILGLPLLGMRSTALLLAVLGAAAAATVALAVRRASRPGG